MDAPWMNDKEWASGRLSSHTGTAALGAWIFAGLSNALIWTVTYLVYRQSNEPDALKAMALFCLVGLGLLIWALGRTWRWVRHGSTVLELASVPGVIGGTLEGVLHTRLRAFPDKPLLLTLTCNRQSRVKAPPRSKSGDTVRNDVLWQADRTLSPTLITHGPHGLSCPFRVPIPYGLPESDESRTDEQFIWRIAASCEVPGVNFDVEFRVPVFVTPQSQSGWTEEVVDAMVDQEERGQAPGSERPPDFGGTCEVQPTALGGMRYDFRLFLSPKLAVALPLTGIAITGGSAALYWWLGEMGPFAIIPGVVGGLVLLASGGAVTYRSRVIVEDGLVTVRKSAFAIPVEWRIPLSEVRGVRVRHEVVEGARGDARDWDLVIDRHGKADVSVGASFRDRSKAEAVAKQLRQLTRA